MNLTTNTIWPTAFDKRITISRRWLITIFAAVIFIGSLFAINTLAKTLPTENSIAISLTNEERIDHGLTPLQSNRTLEKAALAKANDMLENQYFDHISPTGTTPWVFIKESGYRYNYAGENLAIDFSNLEDTHQAWMKSPTHRANILEPHYRDIGIATITGEFQGRTTTITVQMFGSSYIDSTWDKIQTLW